MSNVEWLCPNCQLDPCICDNFPSGDDESDFYDSDEEDDPEELDDIEALELDDERRNDL